MPYPKLIEISPDGKEVLFTMSDDTRLTTINTPRVTVMVSSFIDACKRMSAESKHDNLDERFNELYEELSIIPEIQIAKQ